MKTKFLLILTLIFVITTQSYASQPNDCLAKAETQLELNKCANIGYEEVDAELNRVYTLIKKAYQDDKSFLNKLKLAQEAWIKLRDADFSMMFPDADKLGYYGSVFPTCANGFKTQLTLERVAFLKKWLIGSEEGDACSGSLKNEESVKEALGE